MKPCGHVWSADCRVCWLARYDRGYRSLWGIPGDPEPPPASGFVPPARPPEPGTLNAVPLARVDRCDHLGRREELRHGCGGLSCRHGCDLGLPAVPAGYCQTCEHYDALPGVPWLS